MDSWGTMTRRAIGRVIAGFLLLATPVMAAESPAELISSYRLKHGEVRVVRDATLDRIALEQARAMAAKDDLSHEVLGSFTRRIAPAGAGRAAENIAYGYKEFREDVRSVDRLLRAPQEPAVAQCLPRRDCERQGCKRQAHILGHGDRRRLRAEAGQGQERHGAACCCEA